MWNRSFSHEIRFGTGYEHGAPGGVCSGPDIAVRRIGNGCAVDDKAIPVKIRFEGAEGCRPNARGVLRHFNRLRRRRGADISLHVQHHLGGLRSVQPEGHAAVVKHLGPSRTHLPLGGAGILSPPRSTRRPKNQHDADKRRQYHVRSLLQDNHCILSFPPFTVQMGDSTPHSAL